jgi:DNA-binding NarL/FixJ family response regulator
MRILVAVAPNMYRQSIAHVLRRDRPEDEVHLADPQALAREASSFRPHLVVCNDNVPYVGEEVSVPSWVVIRYHDHLSASVFLDDQDPRLVQDMAIEDLIGVIDETRRLVVGGSSS